MTVAESTFRVCSYNMGKMADFRRLRYFEKGQQIEAVTQFGGLPRMEDAEFQAFKQQYKRAEIFVRNQLQGAAEVYCLQEVISERRPLITALRDDNYEIVSQYNMDSDERLGAVLAISKKRFIDIQNHSDMFHMIPRQGNQGVIHKDVAIASATDRITGERVIFVSAHAPGFDFTNVKQEDAAIGDAYCYAVIDRIEGLAPAALKVIGGDMNANPEIWQDRFDLFTKKGFSVLRTEQPTNVNPVIAKSRVDEAELFRQHQEREVDFIFVSSKAQACSTRMRDPRLGFTSQNNASDHLAIVAEITPQVIGQPTPIQMPAKVACQKRPALVPLAARDVERPKQEHTQIAPGIAIAKKSPGNCFTRFFESLWNLFTSLFCCYS